MILLIDHFDSFTYNIYQAVAEMGYDVEVVRYGVLSVEEIKAKQPEAIILSPGPGHPDAVPESIRLVGEILGSIPLLGICLGQQIIGAAFGAEVVQAPVVRHGKVSAINHDETGIFEGVQQALPVMRYHSLVIKQESIPDFLEVQAVAEDDGTIQAVKHRDHPVFGMQFHPESIGTPNGALLMEKFLLSLPSRTGVF